MLRLLISLYSIHLISSNPSPISLRPKPKARAGGANKKAAPIFSFAFVAEVYIGSNGDFYTLSIGALQNGIWITDPSCLDCKPTTTQYNYSSSYSFPLEKRESYSRETLSLDVEGSLYTDSVSLYEYSPVESQVIVCDKFVDVYNIAVDGILGLGSDKSSIVYKMYEDQLIDKPIYSISMLTSPFLTLGTPNFLDLHLVVESQVTIDLKSSLNVTQFIFDDIRLNDSIPAEINSYSSYIYGPFKYLALVFKKLLKLGCHFEEELLMCKCGSKNLPYFTFVIQGVEFKVTSAEYLIQLGDNCFVGFLSGSTWILGEPFMKAYFLQFDLEKQEMTGFKVTSLGNELPSPFETTEGWGTMIMLAIGLIVLYIVAFLMFLAYERYKINEFIRINEDPNIKKHRIL